MSVKSRSAVHMFEEAVEVAGEVALEAGRVPLRPGAYAFMSARSIVQLDTNAGKPSLTPLL